MGDEHGYDLDLLSAILVARLFQIPSDALQRAGRAWLCAPGHALQDELLAQKLLNARQAEALKRAVDALVVAQGGDVGSALNLVGGPELAWRYLGQLSGRPPEEDDPHATRPMGDDNAFTTISELSTLEEVSGRYSTIADHARGGMGRILLVQDLKMGREVALKELLLPASEDARGEYSPVRMAGSLAARFLQEGRVTASLEHPSIVPVYEIGHRTDGTLYYTMKLVRGKTLSDAFKAAPDLASRLRLLSNFVDVCNAIAYAHSRNVIHRDIKPANIMIGAFGETVVLDWGLAKIRGKEGPRDLELERNLYTLREGSDEQSTQYGEAVGTPSYMSPEQARGELDAVDERSDVYSLGVVLFEMLTGRVPTDGLNASETLRQVAYGKTPSLLSIAPDTPPELASICHKALSSKKEGRYASPLELADEISRFTSGLMVKSYEYTFRQLAIRFYRKNRRLVHLSVAALAVIAMVSAYAGVAVQAARHEARLRAYSAQIRLADNAQLERDFSTAARALEDAEPGLRDELWRVLHTRQNQAAALVQQGQRPVFFSAWALDGNRMITIAGDRTLRLYDFPGRTLLRELRPGPFINNAAVSLNGKRIALAMMDGSVRLISVETGDELGSFPLTSTPIYALALSPDGGQVAVSSFDGSVVVQELVAGAAPRRLGAHPGPTQELVWSNDLTRLCTSSKDGTLQLWAVAAAQPIGTLHGTRPRFSPDGTALAFLSADNVVVVQSSDGTPRHETAMPGSALVRVEYSPEGEWLLSGAEDGTTSLLQATTGKIVRKFALGEKLWLCGFGGAGKTAFACNTTGLLRAWDVETGALLAFFEGPINSMESAAMGPTGRYVVTGGRDGTTRIWDIENSPARRVMRTENALINDVVASAKGDRLAAVSDNDVATFYRTGERRPFVAFGAQSHIKPILVAFTEDGSRAVASLDAFSLCLLDLDTQAMVARLDHLAAPAQTLVCGTGAFATSNSELVWWNLETKEATRVPNTFGRILATALRPGSAPSPTAALGGEFPGIIFYDPVAGREERRIALGSNRFRRLQYAENSRLLAAATDEGDLYFVEPVNGTVLRHFPAEAHPVAHAVFLKNENYFATASLGMHATLKALRGPETAITLNAVRNVAGVAVANATQQVCLAGSNGELMLVPGTSAAGGSNDALAADEHAPTPLVVLLTPERLAQVGATTAAWGAATGTNADLPVFRVGDAIPTADVLPLGLREGDQVLCAESTVLSMPAVASAIARLGNAQKMPGNSLLVQRGGLRFELRAQAVEARTNNERVVLSADEAIEAIDFALGTLSFNRMSFTIVQEDDARAWGTSSNADETVPISIPPAQNDGYVALYKKLGIGAAMRLLTVNDLPPPPVSTLNEQLATAKNMISAGWKGTLHVTLQLGGLDRKAIEYVVQ